MDSGTFGNRPGNMAAMSGDLDKNNLVLKGYIHIACRIS
jgi:hypothetical protein